MGTRIRCGTRVGVVGLRIPTGVIGTGLKVSFEHPRTFTADKKKQYSVFDFLMIDVPSLFLSGDKCLICLKINLRAAKVDAPWRIYTRRMYATAGLVDDIFFKDILPPFYYLIHIPVSPFFKAAM